MQNVVMLTVIYAECHLCWVSQALYADCRYAECSGAEFIAALK
jgi:hypothetical protein